MWQGAKAALGRAVRGFAGDRGLGTEAVYRRITGMSFNAQTQAATPTYTATTLRVIAGQITIKAGESVDTSLGRAVRSFTLSQSDLDGDPRPGDLIILGSSTYRVDSVVKDSLGVRYRIEAELT